ERGRPEHGAEWTDVEQRASERRELEAGANRAAVTPGRARAYRAHARVPAENGGEAVERARHDAGVAVQAADEITAGRRRALVGRTGETEVGLVDEAPHGRIAPAHQIGAPVVGRVVHHDDLAWHGGWMGDQRVEALAEQLTRPMAHDHDGQRARRIGMRHRRARTASSSARSKRSTARSHVKVLMWR